MPIYAANHANLCCRKAQAKEAQASPRAAGRRMAVECPAHGIRMPAAPWSPKTLVGRRARGGSPVQPQWNH